MQISALSQPALILGVQVRSQAKARVQAEPDRGLPMDADQAPAVRDAAYFRVALRETARLADQLESIALL